MTGARETPIPHVETCPGVRHLLVAFGCLNVGLGIAGVLLPVMPTTVFLLIALWAFSRSSPRFHRWLWDHPRLGRHIRCWHRHRVIPMRAKVTALAMMTASLASVTVFMAGDWLVPAALAVGLGLVAGWMLRRPSRVPEPAAAAPG